MKLSDFCGALCSGMVMREVPIGYAIKTPFELPDGDSIAVYVRRDPSDTSQVRLEDDGCLVSALEEDGVQLSLDSRFEPFVQILSEHGAMYDDVEHIIYTEYMNEKELPTRFARFMAALLRIQDLRLLTQSRVREAFKDDLREFLQKHFSGKVELLEDEAPVEVLPDYIADFVLKRTTGETVAIFASSTETKALEALLLWLELKRRSHENIKCMAVFENAKPQRVKSRTMTRLMNSDVLLGAMEGDTWELASKIAQNLQMDPSQMLN